MLELAPRGRRTGGALSPASRSAAWYVGRDALGVVARDEVAMTVRERTSINRTASRGCREGMMLTREVLVVVPVSDDALSRITAVDRSPHMDEHRGGVYDDPPQARAAPPGQRSLDHA